ncbi:hypothetical protein BV20DRAFT_266839 [Pilatotrama ljubarskyi]|nr:hypothetical protein BV20DRAFT_266839 [Pilatotrama ljubarskyi]
MCATSSSTLVWQSNLALLTDPLPTAAKFYAFYHAPEFRCLSRELMRALGGLSKRANHLHTHRVCCAKLLFFSYSVYQHGVGAVIMELFATHYSLPGGRRDRTHW